MRDYSKVSGAFWTDHNGKSWPVLKTARRLKFKYPLHAAHRAFVFHGDGYKCTSCGASAINVPDIYDGRMTLQTNTFVGRWRDVLIVDHIITLKAGGLNVIENFQTLCETCNKKKIKHDNKMSALLKKGLNNG